MSNWPTMWRALLDTQWKWTRGIVLFGVIIGFALPLLSLRAALGAQTDATFIAAMQGWSIGYAIVAAGLGLLVGLVAWSWDHRLRHVYALSLPIERWRYVLLRFAAGVVLLTLPALGLLVGAEIVTYSSFVPKTLHAYPIALTLRFAFATLVAYAIFFAVSSSTGRTAGYILWAIGLAIVGQVVLNSLGSQIDILGRLTGIVFAAPGLLAVFSGRWMLVDV